MKMLILIMAIFLTNCANNESKETDKTVEFIDESETAKPDPNYVDTCTEPYAASNSTQDVLIIGDSISLGYTPEIQNILPNVIHSPCNAGHSYWGVNTIDKYLAARPEFKAITFNFGIWEGYYGNSMTVQEYTLNLRYIAIQIKKKTKNPVFVTTSYVSHADQVRMNDFRLAADSVMKEQGIKVIDIYPMTKNDPSLFGDDGFHLNQNGYKQLADFILLNLFD